MMRIQSKSKGTRVLPGNSLIMVAVALVLVGVGLILAPAFSQQNAAVSNPVVDDPMAILSTGVPNSTGYADRTIAGMQARIKANASDEDAFAELGLAYLQKARETNDPTYYSQAEDALKKALALNTGDYNALAGMGSLDMSRHLFRDALDWGEKAQRISPRNAYAYGVVGDAQIELGNYDQAVNTFQQMVDLRPDLSSYSRVSYARELYGDTDGAIAAMQQAITAGSPATENTAWCRVQLGNLYLNSNQLDKAEKAYNDALQGYPGYLYALAGLAQVRWAQGRTAEAIDLARRSVAVVPLPQFLTMLGEMETAAGNTADAKQQYDLVQYIYHVFEVNGVNVHIEKAFFLADHDMDIPQAVKLAEEAASQRQDVNTENSVAWVYYKAGRYQDALSMEKQAMRLGTQNPLFFFHLGMIYDKLGNHTDARLNLQKALYLNPSFSPIYSRVAQSLVSK